MTKAAKIFSWLGAIVLTIVGYSVFLQGYVRTFNPPGHASYTQVVPYPVWVWLLWALYIVFMYLLVLWRDKCIIHGKKIACGILITLFVSPIGGILTLCIPSYEVY